MQNKKFFFKIVVLVNCMFLLLNSCVTNKDMDYIRTSGFDKISSIKTNSYSYRLCPGDLLSVQISTITKQEHDFFNKEETSNTQLMEKNPYLWGYLIKEDGMLELPSIGKIKAEGFTLRELESVIKTISLEYFDEPVVTLNIINFNIQVLGAVNNPGTYYIVHPKSNIFDAIGAAGDLTEFANRRKIKIIRKNHEKYQIFYIDLTDKRILNNPDFCLYPNDIIYVKPLSKRFYAFRNFPSVISLAVSAITLYLLTK